MVHVSRGALVALAVFFTHISGGHAQAGQTFDVRKMPETNEQLGQPEPRNLPVSTGSSSTTTESSKRQDDNTARPYLLSTVDGVSMDDFKNFQGQPPLAGKEGDVISFPNIPWISCQYINLTSADADEVRKNPIIAFIEPITEDDGAALVLPRTNQGTEKLGKRALPQSLNQRDESQSHLGLLAARNQKNDPTKLPNYVFEPSLGKGQTIYVIDTGYRKTHQEFDTSEREVREFFVGNRFALDPILPPIPDDLKAPEDMTDIDGHGTMTASIAAGYTYGVASLANLVVVKFRAAARNPFNPDNPNFLPRGVMDSALDQAFGFIFSDVVDQRQKNPDPNRRFVINLSYGWITTDHPGKVAIMQRVIAQCKRLDITLVVAAGNDGRFRTLDALTPQGLGGQGNSMITVGGVDKEGKYYIQTVNSNGHGGEVNLYAGAVDVTAAAHNQNDDSSGTFTGTSAAAPAIAGLAAYFFGIPELNGNWHDGTVPDDIKAFMITNSEVRNDNPFHDGDDFPVSPKPDPASLKVPYNLALNQLCDLQAATKRSIFSKRALDPFKSVPGRPIVENGAVTNNDAKNEVCDVHNSGGVPPTPTSTQAPPDPTPTPEPTQAPPPPPPPPPHTASCKVLEQGLGAGKWEVDGSGWGDEASLRAAFGDDTFTFSGGDPFTCTFVSEKSVGDIEKAVRDLSGVSDVTCSS